jgi:hypothetical protein
MDDATFCVPVIRSPRGGKRARKDKEGVDVVREIVRARDCPRKKEVENINGWARRARGHQLMANYFFPIPDSRRIKQIAIVQILPLTDG